MWLTRCSMSDSYLAHLGALDWTYSYLKNPSCCPLPKMSFLPVNSYLFPSKSLLPDAFPDYPLLSSGVFTQPLITIWIHYLLTWMSPPLYYHLLYGRDFYFCLWDLRTLAHNKSLLWMNGWLFEWINEWRMKTSTNQPTKRLVKLPCPRGQWRNTKARWVILILLESKRAAKS